MQLVCFVSALFCVFVIDRHIVNPIQDFYDVFTHNCANLRRKLNKDSTAREKYDTEFKKIRTQALAMKNGLSEDSPKQSIYEYSEFLRVKEDELRELAKNLLLHTDK